MNINMKQMLAILGAVLSVLVVSTAQLTDMFGAGVAKIMVSSAGLLNAIANSVLAVITSQTAQIKDVMAMEGVEKIQVNRDANQTLASIAMDPALGKIEATSRDEAAVQRTAAGG